MVYLDITALISTTKIKEFNQSKMSFIDEIQRIDGYIGFTEIPGNYFQIKIMWEDMNSLNKFMNSETYSIFHGAIITLSKNKNIKILDNEEN